MDLRDNLWKLAAFVVAVVSIILGFTIKLDTIKGWVSSTRIAVSSTTRAGAPPYFAGEVLRFVVEDVQSQKVFWVFDEGQPIVGSIEAQFAFPFDERGHAGQASDHRVDVFFKNGNGYQTANTLVRTINAKYNAAVSVSDSRIQVATPTIFETDWLLTGISLAKFAEGRFSARHSLTRGAETGWVATKNDALSTLGYQANAELPTAVTNNRQAWTLYEFKNKVTGALLTMAQPLSEHMMATAR